MHLGARLDQGIDALLGRPGNCVGEPPRLCDLGLEGGHARLAVSQGAVRLVPFLNLVFSFQCLVFSFQCLVFSF